MTNREFRKRKLSQGELEELLADMEHYKRKRDAFAKRYEAARDELADLLEGQTPFINEAGEKMYALPVKAEDIVFDVEELAEELDEETFAEIIKVSVDREAFRRACAAERISPAVVAKTTKLKPKATSIRFSQEPFKESDSMSVEFAAEG